MTELPTLDITAFAPTRNYLQDAALAIGSLQRGFLPKHPRFWQYGLEVTMRGISTQPFTVKDQELRVVLDFVRHTVRFGETGWRLDAYGGAELFNNFKIWLESQGLDTQLETPKFNGTGHYDEDQGATYAEALWWIDKQFRILKAKIDQGVTSPILLYPHHFDLALSWFPFDDDKQFTIGFSTGDENVKQPYLYLTAYPEPAGFKGLKLPKGAYWQTDGFSGAILPYSTLQSSPKPAELFEGFANIFSIAKPLLG
jgi:hypothetical protein